MPPREGTQSLLRLLYYAASDGPRVVISGDMNAKFAEFQELLRHLSKNRDATVELHRQAFVIPVGRIAVTMRCSDSASYSFHSVRQGIQRLGPQDESIFEWRRTLEGWDYLAELVDSIVRSQKPCHQYLTRYPDEDAIVVLSKGEYDNSTIA